MLTHLPRVELFTGVLNKRKFLADLGYSARTKSFWPEDSILAVPIVN